MKGETEAVKQERGRSK